MLVLRLVKTSATTAMQPRRSHLQDQPTLELYERDKAKLLFRRAAICSNSAYNLLVLLLLCIRTEMRLNNEGYEYHE